MEGPCIRTFPRIALDRAIELRCNGKTVHVANPVADIGVGGLFVPSEEFPLGSPVTVIITGLRPFEVQGVIRYSGKDGVRGVGIEFTSVSDRQGLDDLIADLSIRGLPAA